MNWVLGKALYIVIVSTLLQTTHAYFLSSRTSAGPSGGKMVQTSPPHSSKTSSMFPTVPSKLPLTELKSDFSVDFKWDVWIKHRFMTSVIIPVVDGAVDLTSVIFYLEGKLTAVQDSSKPNQPIFTCEAQNDKAPCSNTIGLTVLNFPFLKWNKGSLFTNEFSR